MGASPAQIGYGSPLRRRHTFSAAVHVLAAVGVFATGMLAAGNAFSFDPCTTSGPDDAAAAVLVLHGGDPFSAAAGASQPFPGAALAEAMAAAGEPARVIACDADGADSGALLSQADRLLAELQPQAVVVVGLAADRFLNDPRQPWLPPAEDGEAAVPVAGPWKERDHFVVFRPRTARELYVFDGAAGPENWRKGVPEAVLEPAGDGVWSLITDESRFHYQVMSREIAVSPGRPLVLTHDIRVTSGHLRLGVLDVAENSFFARDDLPEGAQGERRLEFAPSTDRLRLILHNNQDPAGVSKAEIRRLELHEKSAEEGEGDPVFADPAVMAFGRANLRRLVARIEESGAAWAVATHWTPLFAGTEAEQRAALARHRGGPVHTLRQAQLYSRLYDDMIREELSGRAHRLLDLGEGEPTAQALADAIAGRLAPWLPGAGGGG